MQHDKIGSVMTAEVVRAEYGTPFKEIARMLVDHRISGLPVVDEEDRVIGVISETDLMSRQAQAPGAHEPPRRQWLSGLSASGRRRAAKASARTAGQLMTEPPVTVHADDTIVEAARTMARRQVERLPVVDEEDRLVGIVTRRDLLRVFLRPDAEIREEVVREVLGNTLWLAPGTVSVSVTEGVITLEGHLERRTDTEIAVSMTRQIDGVVDVVDKLTFRLDDARIQPEDQALHGVADNWLRGR
ncbi:MULTISPECIES: CBS domain-containing protein [unclassified Streptomyces]|uniref:CBS domain-containing protein n=1 Tax=unclassified Streptomyces TaxID=2593676 RepID=UPI0027417155|nr:MULTISPECIES: CBS domain-containing protein [unclassified Streptomyces]